jgi:hypothetical protein
VVPFFQKTWFLWWILATLIILRWFHLFASSADDDGASRQPISPKKPLQVPNRFRRKARRVYLPERETGARSREGRGKSE